MWLYDALLIRLLYVSGKNESVNKNWFKSCFYIQMDVPLT